MVNQVIKNSRNRKDAELCRKLQSMKQWSESRMKVNARNDLLRHFKTRLAAQEKTGLSHCKGLSTRKGSKNENPKRKHND